VIARTVNTIVHGVGDDSRHTDFGTSASVGAHGVHKREPALRVPPPDGAATSRKDRRGPE